MTLTTATGSPTAEGPTARRDNGSSGVATVVTPPSIIDLTQDEEHNPAFTFTQQEAEEEETEQHALVGSCIFSIVGIRCVFGVLFHPRPLHDLG